MISRIKLAQAPLRLACRSYSKFSLKAKKSIHEETTRAAAATDHCSHNHHHHGSTDSVQPNFPARTRFAPSPTGLIHLGSLRTALYNYLLAKSTGGQFLLRLEDTDQNRLVQGAEENIYESLKWAGLDWDEGPVVGGPDGPYRQSERAEIYAKYANQLIQDGHAYRCFCSKDRLDGLRQSARALHPPSMASYDRKCSHLTAEESAQKVADGAEFTVRFKAPPKYPEFQDLLHGRLNLQTQINPDSVRYDDPVLVKSDGLPTYHLANVVDDHLMKITHVVRGEEWLPSTPKHVAMYNAFGWTPPAFVHIPLLTTVGNKKLSKRSGDIGVLSLASKGVLPEAMINYVALYGWSPHREGSEVFTLKELEKAFSLDGLTKGNAKVDEKKLEFLNKHFFQVELSNEESLNKIADKIYAVIESQHSGKQSDIATEKILDRAYTAKILSQLKKNITSVDEYITKSEHLYYLPDLGVASGETTTPASKYLAGALKTKESTVQILSTAAKLLNNPPDSFDLDISHAKTVVDALTEQVDAKKSAVLQALRYALSGSSPGIDIPTNLFLLGKAVSQSRLQRAIDHLRASP